MTRGIAPAALIRHAVCATCQQHWSDCHCTGSRQIGDAVRTNLADTGAGGGAGPSHSCDHGIVRMFSHAFDACEDCGLCWWCGVPEDEHEGVC